MPESTSEFNLKIVLRWVTAFISAFAILFVFGLLNKNFAFWGQNLFFQANYPSTDLQLTPIEPIESTSNIGESANEQYKINEYQIDTSETKFELKIPSNLIDKRLINARLSAVYDPADIDQLLISLEHPQSANSITKPLYQKYLSRLDWPSINNQLVLWQRLPQYQTMEEFISDLPDIATGEIKIARYFTELNPIPSPEFFASLPKSITGSSSTPYLEGNIILYAYVSEANTLEIDLNIHELNFYPGSDEVPLNIYNQIGELIFSTIIEDDGITDPVQQTGPLRKFSFSVPDLSAGVYRIVTGFADVHTQVTVNQPHLVMANNPLIVDDLYNKQAEPLIIYTNSPNITLPTWHYGSTEQTILFSNGESITLGPDRDVRYAPKVDFQPGSDQPANQINWLKLGKNHLQINMITGSFLSFSESSFIDLLPIQSQPFNSRQIEDSEIDFILGDYQDNQTDGRWIRSETTIPFNTTYIDNQGIISLDLSAYSAKNKINYTIKEISIALTED
ncbi:MAG: hypothetical protein V1853_02740 [bacterium]